MQGRKIGMELKQLEQMFRRCVDRELSEGICRDITRMQSFVIRFLVENQDKGDLFQRDVEKQFGIRRATATGILQVMERDGLLCREPVQYDARLKKLTLTPKAARMDEQIVRSIQTMEEQTMEGVSPADEEVFWRVFDQMKKNLE